MIEEHATEVNNVNVSTAFRKLLQAPRAGMPRGAVEHSLEALEQRALQTLEDFEPGVISVAVASASLKRVVVAARARDLAYGTRHRAPFKNKTCVFGPNLYVTTRLLAR